MNHLVMGPWFHSQVNREGRSLGPLVWATDTTAQWRQDVLLPFFNQYLKPGSPDANTPPVLIYNPGEDRWERPSVFPQSCEKGCPVESKPLYLRADGRLSFESPAAGNGAKFDEYVSDPAKAGALPPAARGGVGRYGLENMAGHGSALRRWTAGRADVRDGAR